MIPSLPGKALRMLVELRSLRHDSRGFPHNSTCILGAELGRLDIKRHSPGILFISLPIASDYDVIIDFIVDPVSSATSLKSAMT